jgi:hypothetical protein
MDQAASDDLLRLSLDVPLYASLYFSEPGSLPDLLTVAVFFLFRLVTDNTGSAAKTA